MSGGLAALPWRGPGPGRPEDLPLPPEPMPLRFAGGNRKRWRYLGAYSEELMFCAARVQVGPVGQTFWAFWDRAERRLHERTVIRLPGRRGQVQADGDVVRVAAGAIEATMRVGAGVWVEAVCPNGEGGYVWTRKRAPVPVSYDVRLGDRRLTGEALGVEDESAGYHPRHTVWSWCAGVGTLRDGRPVGWNLVEGVNDPPQRSERAVWVAGSPSEPEPIRFEDLDAIAFADGSRLEFDAEAERVANQNLWLLRSSYRQPFGTFRGSLPGGLELERGLGVMEHHDAVW
jgi:Protein of unknown function (DUF2804)